MRGNVVEVISDVAVRPNPKVLFIEVSQDRIDFGRKNATMPQLVQCEMEPSKPCEKIDKPHQCARRVGRLPLVLVAPIATYASAAPVFFYILPESDGAGNAVDRSGTPAIRRARVSSRFAWHFQTTSARDPTSRSDLKSRACLLTFLFSFDAPYSRRVFGCFLPNG